MDTSQLDKWQIDVLEHKGSLCLRSGRQVGKSTVISVKVGEYAVKHANKEILVVAAVERQAFHLYEKIFYYLEDNHPNQIIKKGKKKPTKSKLHLKNGCIIRCLPTGLSGLGIRGYTIDMLVADEAAFIPEDVWTAITPMLATTMGDGGSIILLSTPFAASGYYYDCFNDPKFKSFHVSSEDCPRIDKAWLAQEKERKSTLSYAQEYLGEFVDELIQFFPTQLIKDCMVVEGDFPSLPSFTPSVKNFLGVDVARLGTDDTVLYSLQERNNGVLWEIGKKVYLNNTITQTARDIQNANQQHKYKGIYIDDGGLGVGVFDILIEANDTKRAVVGINNSSRPIDRDDKRKKILKEDLYTELLKRMEEGTIKLKASSETFRSLKSIQYEYTPDKRLKIFGAKNGKYTHITEALIRAVHGARQKSLNIYCY